MFEQTISLFVLLKTVAVFVFVGFVLRNFFFENFKNSEVLKQWTYTGVGLVGLVCVIFEGYKLMDVLGFAVVFIIGVMFTPIIEYYLEEKFGFEFDN